MTAQPPRSYTRLAIAIIVAGVLVSATLYATVGQPPRTITSLSVSTTTTTVTETTTSTVTTSLNTTSFQEALQAKCSNPSGVGMFPTVNASSSSAAVLCVRAYFFSSNQTYTADASKLLGINAYSANNTYFDGSSNFTVIPSPDQVTIGGPNNQNEGAVMAYAMIAKPGASGTYQIGLSSTWVLGPDGPEQCGYYGELVAGTGQPNYIIRGFSGCIAYTVSFSGSTVTNSTKYTVLNNYVLYNGDLYLQISGAGSIPL
jgi:hypothetical protein